MHNLHIGRVNADTHEEASEIVEGRLSAWGDDNNWFSIQGSFCKEDQTFSDEFDEKWLEKEEILNNPHCFDFILLPDIHEFCGMEKLERGLQDLNKYDYYHLHKYFRYKWYLAKLFTLGQFDIWNDTYKDFVFDEVGVSEFEIDEDKKTYLVFFDMHH